MFMAWNTSGTVTLLEPSASDGQGLQLTLQV